MTEVLICEVQMPYVSGLPRDTSINVLHIGVPDVFDPGDTMDTIATMVSSVYNSTVTGQSHPIGYYYADVIDRDQCRIQFTKVSDPIPRPILGIKSFAMSAPFSATTLPLEVAVCATLIGTGLTVSGAPELPLRRRRGRIYHGPFNQTALGGNDANGFPHVSSVLLDDLRIAWGFVVSNGIPGGGGGGLGIYSRAANDFTVATTGYVDDAYDTQRRRGTDPSYREYFVVPGS